MSSKWEDGPEIPMTFFVSEKTLQQILLREQRGWTKTTCRQETARIKRKIKERKKFEPALIEAVALLKQYFNRSSISWGKS